jgi:hypothetical protein
LLQACQAAKGADVYGGLTPALQGLLTPGFEVRQQAAVQAMDMDADLSSVRAFQSCCEEEAAGEELQALSGEPTQIFVSQPSNPALAVKRSYMLDRRWLCCSACLALGANFGLSV